MSLGEGAKAYIVLQDDQTVMYMYGCFSSYYDKNWGEPVDCDGLITIQKECFQEPEIHQKLKRMPSGRKRLVTKKIKNAEDTVEAMKVARRSMVKFNNAFAAGIHTQQ